MSFFQDNEEVAVRGFFANKMLEAYNAVQRVRELHYATLDDPRCQTCWSETYPCPTIKALDGETE